MAKNKEQVVEKTINSTLDDIISDRFGSYSKYIIQERALPDARDGLKPVQRRILYSMYLDGNTYDKPHRKSAKTVGSVMGTFHPHGDSSIYEAMIRMSQDWKINLPLIDIHGNNGSIDDDPPAAMRYTEARLAKSADLLLADIGYQAVTMTNNYDDTALEPTVLPASFPMLLVNGSTGIASGYATNIAPHNLNEVVNATIFRMKNPECSIDNLMQYIKGPDFPTGGIVSDYEQIKEAFSTGKGKVLVTSKCEIVETKTSNQIVISEIPYEVIKAQLVKSINDIALSKQIDGIISVADESGRNGLRIVVECKKQFDAQQILNYLYKKTDLQINYSYNNVAIVNHSPVLMSLADSLDAFIEARRDWVLKRSNYLYEKKRARLHIIEGLIKAISILDDVIAIIRRSDDKKDAKEKLMNAFLFSEQQAEAIVSLRLYRLSNTDIVSLKEENKQLLEEIAQLKAVISSRDVLDLVIIKELKKINQEYITPRKSKIEAIHQEIVIDKLAMIPNESCYVVASKDGYVKRFSTRIFQANENQLPFVKSSDELLGITSADTLDTLLLFTNRGNIVYLPVYKIDECKFKDLGKHASTYVKMESNEKIVSAILVKSFASYCFVLTLSKKGMIKKTSLPKMSFDRTSKEICGMKLKDGDELVKACIGYNGDDVLIITKEGYCNRFCMDTLGDLALKAQGVIGISCKGDDEALCLLIDHHDGKELLLVNDNKGFKRIHIANLTFTNRNAKGQSLFKQKKTKTENIKMALMVSKYATLIITNNEQQFTLPVVDIGFMDTSSGFSTQNIFSQNYYILNKDQSDIQQAEIVDVPADYYSSESENNEREQTSLF